MYTGPYDTEFSTVKVMNEFIEKNGFKLDFSNHRHHNEIYLSDSRKSAPEKLKTVKRYPIIKK